MKLVFTSRSGAALCDWESFALLRDNVQHFIEGGSPSGRFSALHEIARAVDGQVCAIDAVKLRLEVLQAWSALLSVSVDNAAVSSRTRAIREGERAPTEPSVTAPAMDGELLRFAQHWSTPIPRAAESFVAAVLSLTKAAVAGDVLEIRRMPANLRAPSG
jgi:hypothetical protein